jgi:hypothetical protein
MRFSMPGIPISTIPAVPSIEDRSHLFKAVHLEAIRLMSKRKEAPTLAKDGL